MTMMVIQCENFNCIHHSTNNQSTGPSQCTLNSVHIDHTGFCTKNENKPDSQYQTTIIEHTPRDPQLANISETFEQVIHETLKNAGAKHIVKYYHYPTQRQPYLSLLLQTDKDREAVIVSYKPKIPNNTT
ncbi:hypothetical protein [Candidatus Bathycorpusculum sp.]|uniref:hypothetical protein n=1 Tax=Candidatus Bathycorpusculum sp. TaxID=2994959 RepID=UPI00281DFB5B|nr:hypothetical protein [Candidatus Termitimicrobium sp.]